MPVGSGYSPYLYIEGGVCDVAVRFVDTPDDIAFDKEYPQLIEIMYPDLESAKKLQGGKKFRIVEGSKIVGTGVVLDET